MTEMVIKWPNSQLSQVFYASVYIYNWGLTLKLGEIFCKSCQKLYHLQPLTLAFFKLLCTTDNHGILCKTPLVFRYDNQLITISHSSMMVLQPCKYTSSRTTRRRTWLSSAFSMHTTPNYIKLGGRPKYIPSTVKCKYYFISL